MLERPLEKEQINEWLSKSKIQFFSSRFEFLNSHFGLRPGCLHCLLGTSGSGKSSLLKSIIIDSAKEKNVLVLLSEEEIASYQMNMEGINNFQENKKNITFISERHIDASFKETLDEFLEYLKDKIIESKADVFFIDNITTSILYNMRWKIDGQEKTAIFLSSLAKKFEIPIFYVAHTEKGIYDNQNRLIQKEDIRNTATIINITEYVHILTKFLFQGIQLNFINNVKFREHSNAAGFFAIHYNKFKDFYDYDSKITFVEVNKIFKKRDILK